MRPPEPNELSKSTLVTGPPADGEAADLGAVTALVPRSRPGIAHPAGTRGPGVADRAGTRGPGVADWAGTRGSGILAASSADDGPAILPTRLPAGRRFPLPGRAAVVIVAVVAIGAAALLLVTRGGGGGGSITTDGGRMETVGSDREDPDDLDLDLGGDQGGTGTSPSALTVEGSADSTAPDGPRATSPSTDVSSTTTAVSTEPSGVAPSSSSSTAASPTVTSLASTSSTSTTSTSSAAIDPTRDTTPGAAAPGRTGTTTTTTIPASSPTGGGGSPAAGLVPPSGTVIWEDRFDRLDTSVWRLEHSTYGDGNGELQCYRPDNVSVSGGTLVLRARSETVTCPDGSTRQVSSGMVRSRGVTFSPGQAIEFRVKLTPADPSDQGGLWPAVWASSWAGSWPAGGELDWLEVMTAEDPTRAMFSLHHADAAGAHRVQNRGVTSAADFSASWHTIRFDYGRNGVLRWYLDGVPAFTVDGATTLQGWPAPFDASIGEIKINLAVGGRPGPLAPGALASTGATFAVDYIRIVQL